MEDKIREAKEIIDNASNIMVLTGAGISAESGIPTFRGEEGLWKQYRPEDIATPQAFLRDPRFVWKWYDMRRQTIKDARPNPGHYALRDLENQKHKFTLVTQNIDGLHRIVGSKNIIEMHGNIWQTRCTKCKRIEQNYDVPLKELPPTCTNCGAITRPNVVWFGEIIPMTLIDKALIAIEECEVMLIVGTSGMVEPAASMGLVAKQTGKTVIEINTNPTYNSPLYDITILGRSGDILPLFCKTAEMYS
ncbi:MAG TPA: NAD-dependent deacylase [Thermodesulfobacteriota bacterium]|nr:NAD-dependent deacylase [Thermodesulfobacteriota bacterium]